MEIDVDITSHLVWELCKKYFTVSQHLCKHVIPVTLPEGELRKNSSKISNAICCDVTSCLAWTCKKHFVGSPHWFKIVNVNPVTF